MELRELHDAVIVTAIHIKIDTKSHIRLCVAVNLLELKAIVWLDTQHMASKGLLFL